MLIMKDKTIIIILIMLYTSISTPVIKKFSINSIENRVEIVVAENFWDYLSRFSINN